MSDKHEKQNHSHSPSSSTPGKEPGIPIRSLVRKSRAEWLKELCVSLETQKQQKQTQAENPTSRASRKSPMKSGHITLYKPTLPPPPPEKPRSKLQMPQISFSSKALLPVGLAFMVLFPGSIAVLATSSLLKLPTLPNCPKIFWPVASASLRLYCAETAAKKETVEDLLVAIDLVHSLPKDHPLRPEINRQIEQWSMDILNLGEGMFQAGDLAEAIKIARKVPKDTPAYPLVEKQIGDWETLWKKAEEIYRKAEDLMRKERLNLAFKEATGLLSIGNTFWETTKYQELTDLISIAREDSKKLAEARNLKDQGGLDNLLAAVKKIEELSAKSHLKDAGQKEIGLISDKIMDLAEGTLKRGDWQAAINIANKIPESANLKEEVKDFVVLARAHVPALLDTVAGLKDAIAQAQKIGKNRPLYRKAQDYIAGWKAEIYDVATLERARQLAVGGAIPNLKAAITEIQKIPASNPRGDEARTEMVRWTRQIEEIEDKPYLETAEQLASFGDVDSLKNAIAQAQKISQGRALYGEAQNRISQWTEQSQRLEYQPILDRAQELAAEGDFANAIAVAQQIKPGLILYDEAKADIRKWRAQLQDVDNLKNAEQAASGGTPDSLVMAIKVADRVSNSSSWRWRADQLIDQWSQEILNQGVEQSVSDLTGAIATLKKIPQGTSAYSAARSQIQAWEDWLTPAPAPSYEAPAPSYEAPAQTEEAPVEPYEPPTEPYQAPVEPYTAPEPQLSPVQLNKPITSNKPGVG